VRASLAGGGVGGVELSDLSRARDQTGEVAAVDLPAAGLVEITVRLPHLAATARPGEFAQLRAWEGIDPLLRRPMSVAWTEGDQVGFVLQAVGAGTRILAGLRPGAPLQAVGPLGNGFHLEPAPVRALIVSGGVGCAPFPLLVRELRRAGCPEVTVLSGAATAARLYPAERFGRGRVGVSVVEATDDGSRGHRGPVTELVGERCDQRTVVYACGPNAMLAALARRLGELPCRPVRAEVSLEAPMGCGFGTCLGCALPAIGEGGVAWALCCRRGPVMEVGEVAWPQLLALPPAHVA
jgi:dihydroorotate dehydrogenase electron transfer subunit